ncbi:hypothetical protein HMPREF1567_3887 [Providencia alcalifaciens PAL-2]|nr:hypothetical protein HMPREF1562_4262 [Providencia alcalifaciens F90-2004]EUC95415.1 hypothetical protein HMPREF1567_3887 [Providencia alcalifaciens PAL-2]
MKSVIIVRKGGIDQVFYACLLFNLTNAKNIKNELYLCDYPE